MQLQTQQWMNRSHPQTLVFATFLLYFNAAFGLLFGREPAIIAAGLCAAGLCFSSDVVLLMFRLAVSAAFGAAGYLIANDRRAGYRLGLVMAALPLAARLLIALRFQVSPISGDLIGLMFDIALFALLLHPQSREYERIWFK